MLSSLTLLLASVAWAEEAPAARSESVWSGAVQIAAEIDAHAERHWQAKGINPAGLVDDAGFLRRVTLDLAGRVPTYQEAIAFTQDASPDKRQQAVRRLLDGPEYPLHLANVLDEVIQGRLTGDREFIGYLRRMTADGRPWDAVFRQVLLGPWETPEDKVAARFLQRRVNSQDEMTNDAARAFFGVDISCAKCHDHPLVDDWKQQHYYGLLSFFSRTHEMNDRPLPLGEKDAAEVTFLDTSGESHAAELMFLSGQTVDDPGLGLDPRWQDRRLAAEAEKAYLPPAFSPREELVRVALADERFFRRAIANRLWAFLLGRGLVHPVEQMHSGNPSSIPGLVEWLGDDLAANGFNLDRLMAGIALSRVYQRSSAWPSADEPPAAEHFALAAVRPLTHQQYALSVTLALADESFAQAANDEERAARYRSLEDHSYGLVDPLDRRREGFQSSASEALFMSNDPRIQQLARPEGNNLAARLAAIEDNASMIEAAFWTTLGRAPEEDERASAADYLVRAADRRAACGHLVWALCTSAEFRFNH